MCSRPVARLILFIFNVLFFTCGSMLLSFGIAGIADPNGLSGFISNIPGVESIAVIVNVPDLIVNSAVFMIVLGSIMMVFGLLGCLGSWCTLKPLLFFYWLLLILLLIAEIALIIYAAVSPQQAEAKIQTVMIKSLHEKFNPVSINYKISPSGTTATVTLPDNVYSVAWVSMQVEVGCCGVYNYTDFQDFQWNNTFKIVSNNLQTIQAKVPPSCCKLTSKTIPINYTSFEDLSNCLQGISGFNTVGCYKTVQGLAQEYSYIPIGICCCVIVFEVVCIAAAIHLWQSNDDKKSEKV